MALIRPNANANAPLFLSIKDAEAEAKQLVTSARAQAVEVSEQAQREGYTAGERDGQHAGFEAGQAAGRAQAYEEFRQQLTLITQALSQAQSQFEQAQEELHAALLRDCVDLAISLARRITKRQAQIDPQVLAANLEQAMKLVVGARDFRIAFHPHDRAALDVALGHLRLTCRPLEDAKLIEDATLSRGGCRIYTESGTIDADIDAQLDRMVEALLPPRSETI
ncbi:MAG TPA: FliH/SctL family protein [Tepidisphaeraceae bacterium]